MNKEQYLNARKEMMDSIDLLLKEGKIDEANAKMAEVEKMDADFEKESKAFANARALKGNEFVADLTKKGVNGMGFEKIEAMENKKEDVYLNAWAKFAMGKKLTDEETNKLCEVNGFDNALTVTGNPILVPETVADGIWREAMEMYPLYRDVFKTNVKGVLTVIKSAASSDAGWYEEAAETEDGSETFGEMNLYGCELSRCIPVSWKLREMAVEEFIPFIQTMLAEKMGAAVAYGIFEGKGQDSEDLKTKKEPTGIKTKLMVDKAQVVEYQDGTDDLTFKKITELVAKVKGAYKQGAKFYANGTFLWEKIANLVDGNGRPYFIADTTAGGVGRMFGFVVEEDDSVDTIVFGNANKGYHLNTNKPITLDMEDHKKARSTDYIAYAIVDGSLRTDKAFAYLSKKA